LQTLGVEKARNGDLQYRTQRRKALVTQSQYGCLRYIAELAYDDAADSVDYFDVQLSLQHKLTVTFSQVVAPN